MPTTSTTGRFNANGEIGGVVDVGERHAKSADAFHHHDHPLAARRADAHRRYARYRATRSRARRRYAARPASFSRYGVRISGGSGRSRRHRVDRRLRCASTPSRSNAPAAIGFIAAARRPSAAKPCSNAADTNVLPISVSVPVTKKRECVFMATDADSLRVVASLRRAGRGRRGYARPTAKCAGATCRGHGRRTDRRHPQARRDRASAASSSVASLPPIMSGCTAVCESTGSHRVRLQHGARALDQVAEDARAARSPSSPADNAQTRRHRMRHGRHRCRREDVRARALHEPFDHRLMRDRRTRRTRRLPCRACRRTPDVASAARPAASAPRPCGPSTPKPCASSTTSHAPCRSASSSRRASGAISPSMLKTVSVTITLRRPRSPTPRASRSSASASAVRIDLHVGTRQTRAVDQRRMVQRVGEHGVAPRSRPSVVSVARFAM